MVHRCSALLPEGAPGRELQVAPCALSLRTVCHGLRASASIITAYSITADQPQHIDRGPAQALPARLPTPRILPAVKKAALAP